MLRCNKVLLQFQGLGEEEAGKATTLPWDWAGLPTRKTRQGQVLRERAELGILLASELTMVVMWGDDVSLFLL